MNWIEFVGPSGVGKTTFLNKLVENSHNHRRWLTLNEAILKIIGSNRDGDFKEKLMQLYFHQDILNFKKEGYLLRKIDNIKIEVDSKYNPFIEIFFDFISKKEISAIEKTAGINWFLRNIKKLIFLEKNNIPGIVLMDEGLLNNTPNMDDDRWSTITILPNACFFFHLDADSNIKFIKKRAEEGVIRNIHSSKTEKELYNYVEFDHKMFSAKRKFAIERNIPILDINVQADPMENLFLAKEFLNNNSLYL